MARRKLCLLVEDSAVQAQVIMRMMSRLDWNVLAAQRLSHAVEFLASEPIDLILTDLILPDSPDGDTVATLHAARPQAVIAAMSAGGGAKDAADLLAQARADGASFQLRKPFDDARLAEMLTQASNRIDNGGRDPHVIVVDPASTVRKICRKLLGGAGMRVTDGPDLMEILETVDILDLDAVICDTAIPGFDLVDHMADLKDALPGVAIIAISSQSDASERMQRRALAAGAEAALVKPFSGEALVDAVRKGALVASTQLLQRVRHGGTTAR